MNKTQYTKLKAAVLRYTNLCSIELSKPKYKSLLEDASQEGVMYVGGGEMPVIDDETGEQFLGMTVSHANVFDYIHFTEFFLGKLINIPKSSDALVDDFDGPCKHWCEFDISMHGLMGPYDADREEKIREFSRFRAKHGGEAFSELKVQRFMQKYRDDSFNEMVAGKQGIQEIIDKCKEESDKNPVRAGKMKLLQQLFERFAIIYDQSIGRETASIQSSSDRNLE